MEEEFVEVLLQEFMNDIKSLVNWDELEGLIQTPQHFGGYHIMVYFLQSYRETFDVETEIKVWGERLLFFLNFLHPLSHQVKGNDHLTWIKHIKILMDIYVPVWREV